MIKLNLLPKYYGEGKRILITVIVCVVILLIEAVPVLKMPADYKLWTDWFAGEKSFYPTYQKKAEDEIAVTEKWKSEAETYKKFLAAFSRNATQEYNNKVVKSLVDVAYRVGGGGAYFDDMTLHDSNMQMTGNIKGLMNFVNYYFKLSKNDLKLEPMAEPFPYPMDSQIIPVKVSGALKEAMPTQPGFDFTSEDYNTLYVPNGGKVTAPTPNVGGGGAAAPPAGAPAAGGAAPAAGGTAPGGAPATGVPAGVAPPAGGTPPPAGGAPAKTP